MLLVVLVVFVTLLVVALSLLTLPLLTFPLLTLPLLFHFSFLRCLVVPLCSSSLLSLFIVLFLTSSLYPVIVIVVDLDDIISLNSNSNESIGSGSSNLQ